MVQVTRLMVHRADGLQGILTVPDTLLGGGRSEVTLRHGHHETIARLVPMKEASGVHLSGNIWKILSLPDENVLDVHVLWDGAENLLRIGPLLAIMARVRRKKGQLSGAQVPVFERLSEAGRTLGVLTYVFSPLEIQWTKGTVRGVYWNDERKWTMGTFPLPDVVYDQVVSRRFEDRPDVKESRNKLIRLLYPRYFNAGFFDKWTMFQWLSADDRTRRQLPATTLYRAPGQGAQFLVEWGDIYMKPARGSLGQGLVRVQLAVNGQALYRWRKGPGRTETGIAKDPRAWFEQHHRFFRRRRYILQRTIPIPSLEGRVWDVRALMQKDESRAWKRTKMFVRISHPGEVASNLAAGGRAERVEKVLPHMALGLSAERGLVRRLTRTAHHVAQVVEESSGLQLGEMGVDLGVDDRGGVWIIEVNAKPWKSPDTDEGDERLLERSFLRPVAYAKSLAGFSP